MEEKTLGQVAMEASIANSIQPLGPEAMAYWDKIAAAIVEEHERRLTEERSCRIVPRISEATQEPNPLRAMIARMEHALKEISLGLYGEAKCAQIATEALQETVGVEAQA